MLSFFKKVFKAKPSVDFHDLVRQGAVVVDVRSPAEFREGHINGSKNYPLDGIRGKVVELKKRNKPVITVCRSGARSAIARNILKSSGIDAYNGGPWTSLQKKI